MTITAESPQSVFAQKWAVRFGAASLAAVALAAGLATWDRLDKAVLETEVETTAVGDETFFRPSKAALHSPLAVTSMNGQPLRVSSMERIEVRDTHVRRVTKDAATGLTIYELSSEATTAERERAQSSGKAYLLKVAPGEYVKAHAAAP